MTDSNIVPPKFVFIVPYRKREEHKHLFKTYMKHVLEDIPEETYEIYFSHQADDREFNRGAVKNIGFLAIKDKYPNHYKTITFVFNDVDTMPYSKNIIRYDTKPGVIKHFYGYKTTLGGIVSIQGYDFEKLNGFPNYWGWGFEDNALNQRALKNSSITINRDTFFNIGDLKIVQSFEAVTRRISATNKKHFLEDDGNDGLSSISYLSFSLDETDKEERMININTFNVTERHDPSKIKEVHMRNIIGQHKRFAPTPHFSLRRNRANIEQHKNATNTGIQRQTSTIGRQNFRMF